MNDTTAPPAAAGLSWPLIGGLALVALLWPLSTLTGAGTGAPRALLIITVTAAVWIGVVGLGRVARPVATLTLTGLASGVLTSALGLLLGGSGPVGGTAPVWALPFALALDVFWGFVAGLVAAGVQRLRGVR